MLGCRGCGNRDGRDDVSGAPVVVLDRRTMCYPWAERGSAVGTYEHRFFALRAGGNPRRRNRGMPTHGPVLFALPSLVLLWLLGVATDRKWLSVTGAALLGIAGIFGIAVLCRWAGVFG